MFTYIADLVEGGTLVILLLWLLPTSLAAQPTPEDLLRDLQAKDRVLSAGFAMTLQLAEPAHPFDPDQGTETRACSVTGDGTTYGLKTASAYSKAPVYRPAEVGGYGPVDYDAESNLILWRTTQRYALSTPERNDAYVESQMLRVSRTGDIVEKVPHVQFHRYKPGDEDNLYELPQILMALGRGFSAHLERITSVTPSEGGRLEVMAQGTYGPKLRGVWQLLVDANAARLVRKASFVKEGSSEPLLVVESAGTTGTEEWAVAQRGTVRHVDGPSFSYELSVELQSYTRSPDTALLDELQKRLTAALPRGAEIIDFSSNPPVRTFVEDK